jgi:hypothetical protein
MNEQKLTDAEQALRQYERRIAGMPVEAMDLTTIECELRALADARAREVVTVALRRADTEAPEVEIDGERWGNRQVTRGEYHTTFGVVMMDRSTYQRAGRGRVAIPLDLRLGIMERRYTPKMGRIMTRAIATMPEQEAADFLAELGTAQVSSSTLSRIPQAITARYETRRAIIEAKLRAHDVLPEDAVTVQVGIDGVMVPQDGEHARRRGRKTDAPAPARYEQRYGPVAGDPPAANDGSLGRAWHEASVGTLAYFDAEGRRLKTVYLARMPEPFKATLVGELEAELHAALAERPALNIVFASDGAAPQWASLEAITARLPPRASGHRMNLVDAFHVAEYLQKGANAIAGTATSEATILAATWRETIKEKPGGAETVLRSMRARRPALPSATRVEELDAAIGYIAAQNEAGRMAYAEAKARHYPIGTGVTEAAGKTLISTRMKRAGARFSQHGGQTILLFRAALLSDRFEALHETLRNTYEKRVKCAA